MKKNFTFLKLFSTLVFLVLSIYSSTAQNDCCRALDGFFNGYCIGSVPGCMQNVSPCNDAGFDAAFGPGNYTVEPCSPSANCSIAACGAGNFVVLPVELISFEANFLEEGINIAWKTASEEINEGFYLESSRDAKNWSSLGFIPGNGTTFEVNKYSFMDNNPYLGLNYYRLKQLDTDGTHEYSNVITMLWQGGITDLKMVTMPNPAREWMTVVLPKSITETADTDEEITYEVFSSAGQLMFTHTNIILGEVRIDLTSLAKGNYFLRTAKDGMIHNANFTKID